MTWIRPPGPVADGLVIGLFGGSFNPAHEGHRHVAETARKALGLDHVWWLVTPGNPLKRASDQAELWTRRAGVLALHPGPRHRVTDIEAHLGTRFTVDTVRALQRRFAGVRFVWLMGSDNLASFTRWKDWAVLARLLPIVVVRRPGSALAARYSGLVRRFGLSRRLGPAPCILLLDGRRSGESATRLRAVNPRWADSMGHRALEPRLPAC